MDLGTRKALDRYFSSAGYLSVLLIAAALVVLLGPIVYRGLGAFVFRGTMEHRRLLMERFNRGNPEDLEAEIEAAREARAPVYAMLEGFEAELKEMGVLERRKYEGPFAELEDAVAELLGPAPGSPSPILPRQQYGQTRWDRARVKLNNVLYVEQYDYSDPAKMGQSVRVPRAEDFLGTSIAALPPYVEAHAEAMLRPRLTVYWGFFFDNPLDAHMLGGIWPEILGTVYLTLGAMLFAVPLGVISAVYLAEYARDTLIIGFLRVCISTLAGVPSIVFGLFGLAFFINTLHVSSAKSVLAGSLTLAILVLPTVIRASEEALKAVPDTYREAALSLGSTKWRAILKVVLPSALPGVLTSIIMSMGRAAGETAPIIFTAAVSVGRPLKFWQTLTGPTPALSWNIYNLCSEHEAVDEIRHVQFGMVLTLVMLVLLLNTTAIAMRARISKRLKG